MVPGDVDEATDLGLLRSATSNTVTSVGTLTTVQGSVYNDLHQVVSSTVKLPDSTLLGDLSNTEYTTAVGYDGLGQPVSTTVGALGTIPQETLVMGYGLSGVAQTMGVKQGDAGSMSAVMPLVTEVSFSGTGQLSSRKYANGLVRQYGWDSQTRALTAVVAQFPDLSSPVDANGDHQYVTVQHDEFTRDVMGRITQSTNEVPVVEATTANGQVTAECFTYDGFNRLSAAWTVADASSPVCGGQAPALGTVGWDASGTAYQAQWVYTLAGKIDAVTQSVAAGASAVTRYDYSTVHPAAVTSTTQGAATTGAFTYDGAGRMDSRGVDDVTTALDWDVTSSLVESGKPDIAGAASTGQGGHIVYAYDASGQRVAQAVVADANHTGSATAYVVSGEVTDTNTATPAAASSLQASRYYTFGGSTVAVRTATGLALVLGDEQGSVSVTMPVTVDTATGAVSPATVADAQNVTRTAYTPFGVLRGDDNLALSRGWLGQVEDRVVGTGASSTGTGLTYLNARYYDPATSRFISPDPLMNPGDPTTLDPYRYADNNPVVFTDASGLRPACASGGARDQDACYYGTTGVELNPILPDFFKGGNNREYDRGMNGPKRPHKYPGSNISGLDAGILWLLPDFSSSAGKTTVYSDGDRMVGSLKKTNHYQVTLPNVLAQAESNGGLSLGQLFNERQTRYNHFTGAPWYAKPAIAMRDGQAAVTGEQAGTFNESLTFLGSHAVDMTVTRVDRTLNDDGSTTVRVSVGIVAGNKTTVESLVRVGGDGFASGVQSVFDFGTWGSPAAAGATESQELRLTMKYEFTVGAG